MRRSLTIEPRPPTPEEMRSAPLLEDWAIVTGGLGVRLTGNVSGHPQGPAAGPMTIITSTFLDVDPGLAWARTENRFYRLGVPQDPAAYAAALAGRWAIERGQGDAFTANSGASDNEAWNWSKDMTILGP